MKSLKQFYFQVTLAVFGMCVLPVSSAFAAAAGMPWEGPLTQLLNSLTGPISRIIGAVCIIVLGFGLAFSEGGSFAKKALWVVMGLAISFNAVSWGLGFLGFGGGLAI